MLSHLPARSALPSSRLAEAVVTTDINAVVVATLSSPHPQLGPLNLTSRPPRLGQGAELVTEASSSAPLSPQAHAGHSPPARRRQPDPPLRCELSPELLALIQTFKLATNLKVNIYTDSKYAFGICHAMEQMWRNRGNFLIAVVTEISH